MICVSRTKCLRGFYRHGRTYSAATCNDKRSILGDYSQQELKLLEALKPPVQKPIRSSRSWYHAILIQLKLFPDQNCAAKIKAMVRLRYSAHEEIDDPQRLARLRINAKKCLITLQKANLGDRKALTKILETAYGQRGRLRHEYLGLITSELVLPAPELISGKSRSRPPVVGDALLALWNLQFEKKKIEVELPEGPGGEFGKPLDKRREVNLRWRHHTTLLDRTKPPVPSQDLEVIATFATGATPVIVPKLPDWRVLTQREMNSRVDADAHHISVRMIRRLYSVLLNRIPILYRSEEGTWRARFAGSKGERRPGGMIESQSFIPDEDFDPIAGVVDR